MANSCVNGTLDQADYSSPVPVIGLYIAAGTLVCLLFMLFDIFSAIRHRQRWIPCRLFSLNSVTLTLMSIVSKVPVDLTTSMPSVHDQLSKLTATTLICICIGFTGPSVANSSGSEYISNIAALSILDITIVVNVCIQLSTGVIHLFIVEHIIIMFSMLLLPLSLWYSAYDVKVRGEDFNRYHKFVIANKGTSMIQRLKLCYLSCFHYNPQFKTCTDPNYATMAGLCIVCFCVLLQASVRSLVLKQLKFCGGNSDYDWSMWIIVLIQILAVTIGCFATSYRWFTMFTAEKREFQIDLEGYGEDDVDYEIRTVAMLGARPLHKFRMRLRTYGWYLILLPKILIMMPTRIVFKVLRGLMHQNDPVVSDPVPELEDQLKVILSQPSIWTKQQVVSDIARWKEVSKRKPLKHLYQLLSRTHPSRQINTVELKASSFTMALLVRISSSCVPCELTKSLERCMVEAYEIVHFVESRIKCDSRSDRDKCKLTKAVLVGDGFDVYLPRIIASYGDGYHSQSPLRRATWILSQLKDVIGRNPTTIQEIGHITDVILRRQYESGEELCCYMEQIFVDMLHSFFTHLPRAIVKEMSERSPEDFNDRIKHVFKLLFDVEPMEAQVQWSFPAEYKFTGLTSSLPQDVASPPSQNEALGEDGIDVNSTRDVTDDASEILSTRDDDVSLDIEELLNAAESLMHQANNLPFDDTLM